ncbi:SHOCT domain-containing protein [Pseudodesulfovibrio sp. zrk46]|nr:SHOCT domain-containing protein [Pseudodesulfovibrio sp. zrk46]
MILENIPMFLADFFDFLNDPMWRAWPFNSGYGEHILPAIARMVFVALIFGVIILFLRALYGPKGIFRDKEMEREAEELTRKERAEVEKQFANGEISEMEYKMKMHSLRD